MMSESRGSYTPRLVSVCSLFSRFQTLLPSANYGRTEPSAKNGSTEQTLVTYNAEKLTEIHDLCLYGVEMI